MGQRGKIRVVIARPGLYIGGMKVSNLEAALKRRPFKPFEIRIDGDVLVVEHPEEVLLTEEKTTIVVADREEHLHIFDSDQVSKIRLLNNGKRNS